MTKVPAGVPGLKGKAKKLDAPLTEAEAVKAARHGHRWNGGEDGRPRAWYLDLDKTLVADEETFLAESVYGGDCRHERVRVDSRNRFSDRA